MTSAASLLQTLLSSDEVYLPLIEMFQSLISTLNQKKPKKHVSSTMLSHARHGTLSRMICFEQAVSYHNCAKHKEIKTFVIRSETASDGFPELGDERWPCLCVFF